MVNYYHNTIISYLIYGISEKYGFDENVYEGWNIYSDGISFLNTDGMTFK